MLYSKVDWLTFVVFSETPKTILEKIGIDFALDDLVANCFDRDQGYDTRRVFTYNGISLDFNLDDVLHLGDDENVFEHIYKKFRVDISGSGLDYLRSINIDADALAFDLRKIWDPNKIRPTRIDYAFDIVNEHERFLYDFISEVKAAEISGMLSTDSRMKFVNGRNGGTAYSYRWGQGQCTFYFGTPRSEALLRIYDKKLQYSKEGLNTKKLPDFEEVKHNDLKSWYRIELQTRSRFCCNFLLAMENLAEVKSYICSNYHAINPATNAEFEALKEVLGELYEMKIVYQHAYDRVITFNEQLHIVDRRILKWQMYFYIKYGGRWLIEHIQNEINNMIIGNDEKQIKQRRAFAILLARDREENGPVYANEEYYKRLQEKIATCVLKEDFVI